MIAQLTVVGYEKTRLIVALCCSGIGLDAPVSRRRRLAATLPASTATSPTVDHGWGGRLAVELAVTGEISEADERFVREGQDAGSERLAIFVGNFRPFERRSGNSFADRCRIMRRIERARDDADRAKFGCLFRVQAAREPSAEGAPKVFLFAQELAKRVDEFPPRDGPDRGGQDFAAVPDLVPVLVLVLVRLGCCSDLLVELGEPGTVRRDESVRRVEPEQIEGVEPATRRDGGDGIRRDGPRAIREAAVIASGLGSSGKDYAQVRFAQAVRFAWSATWYDRVQRGSGRLADDSRWNSRSRSHGSLLLESALSSIASPFASLQRI